ncbi:hypothetical protein BRD13_00025 [Halobacteriales archaeon SW_5_70_135]|nr:MAG: hypothetical protein BRD13_00025 [Halobacteriales archaeon SW_5_70_135]
MDTVDGDGPPLRSLAAAALLAVAGPLAAALLADGAVLLFAVLAVAGVAALWVGASWYLAGRSSVDPSLPSPFAADDPDALASLSERAGFGPVDTVSSAAVYETRVDGRPVTLRRAGEDARTVVETPLSVARVGTGFVAARPDDEDVPPGTDLPALLRTAGGELRVDDRIGVVTYTAESVADPDVLAGATRVVAAVAGVVEDRAAPDDAEESTTGGREVEPATNGRRRLTEEDTTG